MKPSKGLQMTTESFWDEHRLDEKVLEVLSSITYHNPDHHLGRPFLTAYQLAIALKEKCPSVFHAFGHPIGGKDCGDPVTFAQYVAGQMSRRIRNGTLPNVEGGFLSNLTLRNLEFNDGDEVVVSSLTDSQYDLSMFRYVD